MLMRIAVKQQAVEMVAHGKGSRDILYICPCFIYVCVHRYIHTCIYITCQVQRSAPRSEYTILNTCL